MTEGTITIRIYGETLKIDVTFNDEEKSDGSEILFWTEKHDLSVRLNCTNGQIVKYDFLEAGQPVFRELVRNLKNNPNHQYTQKPNPNQQNWMVNKTSNEVYFGGVSYQGRRHGVGVLVDLSRNSFLLAQFMNNQPRGAQKKLVFGERVPYLQKYEMSMTTEAAGCGRHLMRNARGVKYEGRRDWKNGTITISSSPGVVLKGGVKEANVDGKCLLRYNELVFKVEFRDGMMMVDNFEDMFARFKDASMEKTASLIEKDEDARKRREEGEDEMVTGFSKVKYDDGSYYQGYLIEDYVYCHKDVLPTCFFKVQKEDNTQFALGPTSTKQDAIVRFLSEVEKFKGKIHNWRVDGIAQIKYHNGNVYKGRFNEMWKEQGNGLLIYASGDVYKGGFKDGQVEGFGKLVTRQQGMRSGYFSNGELKVEIGDEDEMTYDEYDKIVKKVLVKKNFEKVFLNEHGISKMDQFLKDYRGEGDEEQRKKLWDMNALYGQNDLEDKIFLDNLARNDHIMVSQVMGETPKNPATKQSVILMKSGIGGGGQVPTNKQELVKSILGRKNQPNNIPLNQIVRDATGNEPKNRESINDMKRIANEIEDKGLLAKPEAQEESIDLNHITGDLKNGDFKSHLSDSILETKPVVHQFENGYQYEGVTEEGSEEFKQNKTGKLLDKEKGEIYSVKLTMMGGTKMGVFNDFQKQKVFFVDFEKNVVTPSG